MEKAAPLAVVGTRRKVGDDNDDDGAQHTSKQQPPPSPKRVKATGCTRSTFCLLPFHFKVLKSLYDSNSDSDSNVNEIDDVKDEVWEMASNFLKSRVTLWNSKQEALRCRAVSARAQNYVVQGETPLFSFNDRAGSRNNHPRRRPPRHIVPAVMLRQPLTSSSSAYAYAATSAPRFLSAASTTPGQSILSLSMVTTMASPPFNVAMTAVGQNQESLQQQPNASFGIVAALLKQQSASVHECMELQIKPFRPLLERIEQHILARLVTSLRQQRCDVLEMEEWKLDDLLSSTSYRATITSTTTAATTATKMNTTAHRHHCYHQDKGEYCNDIDLQQQEQNSSCLLAATKSKICLWNMLAMDLKAIINISSED
jgi:hypothetical protein